MLPSRLRIAASTALAVTSLFFAVPAFASGSYTVTFAAPRHASVEALLGLPPAVEAPKAVPVVEAPLAHLAPVVDEPRAASPDLSWASAMRAFAER